MGFQIGGTEWIFVVIVVVVLMFGSKKVPELARSLGKAMGEFQKGRAEFEREIRAATQAVKEPMVEVIKAIPEPINDATQRDQRDRLEKAANDLGIPTDGKTNEQLKEELRKSLS